MAVRIFIADDEPSIPKLIEVYLDKLIDDLEVTSALNGQEAVQKIRQLIEVDRAPHVTLMDLVMPVMDGIECTGQLRELGLENIYVLTAHVDPELIDRAVSAGARGLIRKSEGFKAVAERVADLARGVLSA